MKIAATMNVHADPELVLDTIDSVRHHMTGDIIVVCDQATAVDWARLLPCGRLEGFRHGFPSGPYRNMTLGLKYLQAAFPRAEYYCYLEPDVLVASDEFKDQLDGRWAIGNDHRLGTFRLPMIDRLIQAPVAESHYLLGCCVFYHRDFLAALARLNFFDRFLQLTQPFQDGFYPEYREQGGYDLGEHLYPTMAAALGGRVGELACYREGADRWSGDASLYPLRWRPELPDRRHQDASLLHPIKSIHHQARAYHRSGRSN